MTTIRSSTHPSGRWSSGQYRAQRGEGPAAPDRFADLMAVPSLPRAARYDPVWVWWNHMGPNALWLTEALLQAAPIDPGARVLDLGCGTGMSSIYIAREHGAEVWATDLWTAATDNRRRFREADLDDRVFPVHAAAAELPFADEFFDAMVSVDAYHYFGTDDVTLERVVRLVRPGGLIAVIVPGHADDASTESTFHSAPWWRALWSGSDQVDLEQVEMLPDGWALWHRFCEAAAAWEGHDRVADVPDGEMILADRQLGFVRLVARRRSIRSSARGPKTDVSLQGSGPGRSPVVQRGSTLIRPSQPWTPAVHALLRHLESAGFDGAPRVVGDGYDDDGHETITYIPGEFVHPHAWSEPAIRQLGQLLRATHDATSTFEPPADAVWQPWFTRSVAPAAVIGHGDTGPWNVVAREGVPVAFIDWEFAGPVDRLDEVAQTAWLNAQLHDDDIAERQQLPDAEARAQLLAAFLEGYGLTVTERRGFVERMIAMAIRDAANEAIVAEINPWSRDFRTTWALAWRSRSAAWMVHHRSLLQRATRESVA